MAGGIKNLRKIQWTKETTAGTAVSTATLLWRGLGTIEDLTAVSFIEEDIGYLSQVDRTTIGTIGAKLELEPVALNIFQLPYLLEMGVKAITTGASDGSGSDKVYAYTLPTTAKNTINTFSIQGGDDTDVERMEYGFADTITLTGKANEPWKMSATLMGRQVTDVSTFNPTSLALQTQLDDLLFNKSKLYIDAAGGTVGTTQVTNAFLEATIKLKTGWFPRFTGDGNLYFSYPAFAAPLLDVDLTFVHDATAVTRKTDWRTQVARLFRINVPGAAVTTAGTTYANNTLRIDFASKGVKIDKLGEMGGEDVLHCHYSSRYNATGSLYASVTVALDGITALP